MRAPLAAAALGLCAVAVAAPAPHRSELWSKAQEAAAGVDTAEHAVSPRPHMWVNMSALPEEFSWMNVGGANVLTKSLNQHIPQYCGSCWAHGTLSALADRIKIARKASGVDGVDIDLSVQHLLNCGTAGSCHGGSGGAVYNWIKGVKGGIAYDTCQPYMACSKESSEGFCNATGADWTCTPENVCRTCATFGTKCVGLAHYPNATVNETGEVSGQGDGGKNMMAEIHTIVRASSRVSAQPTTYI